MPKGQRSTNRKEQIVKAVYDLVLKHGIRGTTTARIAAQVGVSEAALYRHFKNRQEILFSLLELVATRFMNVLISDNENVPDYINSIGTTLYRYIMSHPEDAKIIYEFICAPPSENLRGNFKDRLLDMLNFLEEMLVIGINQGTIRKEINPRSIAWQLFGLGSSISFAAMLDIQQELSEDLALNALGEFLDRIRA